MSGIGPIHDPRLPYLKYFTTALCLAIRVACLGPGWPILALVARTGLENATLIPCRGGCLGSERVFDKLTIACSLMTGCG